ncbi:hypothetical protein PR048_028146 [Dryococelus australis]|uniref:Uncharacterized protein n=1 Tax=Dryococelus australis TaxID=614101 RepID=A0ABQ9GID3_9NEOP|nr:hypothetical protein PR048_028146 [Dryococelus australis]
MWWCSCIVFVHLVEFKAFGYVFRCKKKCLEKLGEDNCIGAFTKFHDIPTKNEQGIFVHGLIDIQDIKRRPSFKYHLLVGSSQVNVCLKAFVSGFGVTTKRARKITKLKQAGGKPTRQKGQVC